MKNITALLDCNNFFVSCERVFNPKLVGKPTLVLSSNDGCVVARSQEVKDLGIPMGIPYFKVRDELEKNKVNILSSNFKLYRDMSNRVMTILEDLCGEIEIYSIDEAFIDMSREKNPYLFSENLQQNILKYTGIPVSVGISKTKTLAKAANHISKTVLKIPVFSLLDSEDINTYLKELTPGKIWGIGRETALKLSNNNIRTAYDFKNLEDQWIEKHLGVGGLRLAFELRGIPARDLGSVRGSRKSIMSSRSFGKAVTDLNKLRQSLSHHVSNVAHDMREEGSATSFISVSIRTNRHKNIAQNSRAESRILDNPTSSTIELTKIANQLLDKIYLPGYEYVKTGVMVTSFSPIQKEPQRNLFGELITDHDQGLMDTIDSINNKLGNNSLKLASEGFGSDWVSNSKMKSKEYTTKWSEIVSVD